MTDQETLDRILEVADATSNYAVYHEDLQRLDPVLRADALGTGMVEVRDKLVALVRDIDPAMVPWWAEEN